MKKEIDTLDATPSKRLFLSIIADYDLHRSICELVDNGLDVWVRGKKAWPIEIELTLDVEQQLIIVKDNAGGLKKAELRYIVGPGQTGTSPTDETIGIFGVGTKRAVVALSQDIQIRTRHGKEPTHQIDFDDSWLQDDEWQLPVYQVDNIEPGATVVELHKLRIQITEEVILRLKEHLSATYGRFLTNQQVSMKLNGNKLSPIFFENWAYPPEYAPRRYTGTLKTADCHDLRVEVVAGLSRESSPAAGEYGVYFYCNERLIARAQKSFDVGFAKGLAGLPHPKLSLTRVIVHLNGNAQSMPWNSSKSDINTKHEVFVALRQWLVQVVKDFASLSRIWTGNWQEKVFRFTSGTVAEVPISDFPTAKRSFLPPLPKSRPRYGEIITQKNRAISKEKPWTRGLYEGVIAADLISKQRLDQRNRIALILLDSTLEIAFKEYLVNESGKAFSDKVLLGLFSNRANVQNEIKNFVSIKPEKWKKIDHYYRLRCKLIHERAAVGISDEQVQDFREVVESVLRRLYKLKFSKE